jgi:Kef-type K+ transport system membrane component KefB
METSELFLKLLIALVAAKLFADLFAFLGLPFVLGEVVAGVIIGPSLLGLIRVDATFHFLAEMGILLLLFEVGLETDVGQLLKVGTQSALVALTGIVAPGILGFWMSVYLLGLPIIVSLFIGGTLVATSIGITVRVLVDLGKDQTKTANIVIGAAVLDDVVGVIVLAVLYDFTLKGEIDWTNALSLLCFILAFLMIAPLLARLLVPFLARYSASSKIKGVVPSVTVALILAMAVISQKIGAPAILGAFVAGVAMDKRFLATLGSPFRRQADGLAERVEESMKPITDLFTPFFFAVVGASIDLSAIDFASPFFWKVAAALTLMAVIGKVISGTWVKGDLSTKLATGIAMVPRGEVGLIFAEVGRANGVFDETIYAVVVFVVFVTTLLPPLVLGHIMRRVG